MRAIRAGWTDMTMLDDISFEIDPGEVFARLHLDPHGQYAGEVNALVAKARRVARPRALYKAAIVERTGGEAIVIAHAPPKAMPTRGRKTGGGQLPAPPPCGSMAGRPTVQRVRFTSRALRVNLDGVGRVFAYVATCGAELDSISVAPGDVFGQFCRDTIKEMALWAALAQLYVHLTETHQLSTLASMNPGSGEANVWPIEQQRDLFAFLGDVQGSIGVALTASCLMVPNKSVSGIFYPSNSGFESCQLCRQERCSHRRAQFDPALWARTFGEAS
jgi:hypothetical protein